MDVRTAAALGPGGSCRPAYASQDGRTRPSRWFLRRHASLLFEVDKAFVSAPPRPTRRNLDLKSTLQDVTYDSYIRTVRVGPVPVKA